MISRACNEQVGQEWFNMHTSVQMPIMASRYTATRSPQTLYEFKICNSVCNQHITNTWSLLHLLGVCIPPLHTITSLLPIFQVFFFQNLLQKSQVWKVYHPHSIDLSQLSTIAPHWTEQITQQTTEIDMSLRTVQQKYNEIKCVKNSFSSSCVKCKGSGPTL